MVVSQVAASRLEDVLARCRALVEAPDFESVARWKARHPGAKAVGCYPVYIPVEVIHAGGMLPVGVFGGGNRLEIGTADSRFQSFVCSIVKSTLELAFLDRVRSLDAILFTSLCDPARNLASVYERNFPRALVEYLHYPQNLSSPSAMDYLSAEFRRLKASLETLTGRPIADDEIRASIALYNRVRTLLRDLYALRAEAPHLLSAAECYVLVRAGTLLPPEEYLELLQEAVTAVRQREARPKDRIRVVLEGSFCEQPPLELIETVEQAGCYILDDDFLLGWRFFTQDVSQDGDPVRALTEAYVNYTLYMSSKHDLREPKARHLVERVHGTGADGVIILAPKFCEPALFDYALYRRALDAAEIRHLFLEFQETEWVFDSARTQVETFVESILFV